MNIFQNPGDLLGSREAEQPGSVTNLLRLAAEIRTKLSGEGYLIESYLSRFFQAVIASSSQEAVSDGYETSSELRDLCFYALDAASGDLSSHKHRPFQPATKSHMNMGDHLLQKNMEPAFVDSGMIDEQLPQTGKRDFAFCGTMLVI